MKARWRIPRRETSRRTRVAVALAVQMTYPVTLFATFPYAGDSLFPLAVVPVGLAAWWFGTRLALFAAAAQIGAYVIIRRVAGEVGLAGLDVVSMVLVVVVALSIGFLRAVRADLARRAREAEGLAAATRLLAEGSAANKTLHGILTAAMSVVPSTVASFIVPADSGSQLRVAAILGGPSEWVGRLYPIADGVSGRAWRARAITRVDDVSRDSDYVAWTPISRSALAVPVTREGEQRGLIYFEDARVARFGEREVRMMEAFADHAWLALEREARQRQLDAATDRFAVAFNAVPSGLVITRASDRKITEVNDAFLAIIDRTRAEVVGRTTLELGVVDEDTSARVNAKFERDGRLINESVTTDRLGRGTQHFLVSSDVALIAGQPHIVTVATDETERRRTVYEIEQLALYDGLTGLPNRNQLVRQLRSAVARAGEQGRALAVLHIDIDHFKDINNTFGHRAADDLLVKVAARLRADLADGDIVARLGGDEFAILLESDASTALQVAETARRSLEIPFEVEGQAIVLTGSVGISFYPEHGRSESQLLQRADIAMNAAKRTQAGTTVYASALDAHGPAGVTLAADLRRAISDGLLAVHYQPIVPLVSGRCFGVEALARWNHPVRGNIAPAEFVPAAERSGLIRALSTFVLRHAVDSARSWSAVGRGLEIAVNVSMRDLYDPKFIDGVARQISEHDLPAQRLCLEITESVAMADPDHTLAALRRLREVGVRIAIDDFGTGYSSLAYLRRMPVDALKIDRSFVTSVVTDAASTSIVKATIDLGHSLGLTVIAEGVETDAQLARIRGLGCDCAQGFGIGRPMPASDIPKWIAAEARKFSS